MYSHSRKRIIATLSSILFAQGMFRAETPAILQTLLQSLFSLLAILRSSPDSREEADTVAAYIVGVKEGQAGTPTQQALEREYGVRHSKGDSDEKVREIILAESVIGCLETGSDASRRWTLHNLVEVPSCHQIRQQDANEEYVSGALVVVGLVNTALAAAEYHDVAQVEDVRELECVPPPGRFAGARKDRRGCRGGDSPLADTDRARGGGDAG